MKAVSNDDRQSDIVQLNSGGRSSSYRVEDWAKYERRDDDRGDGFDKTANRRVVMKWPAAFMWGTGASSTQCEGAAPESDWWDWERSGHAPVSGDGTGFATRDTEDFAYGGHGWPPGTDDSRQRAQVDETMQLADAEGAVRLRQTVAPASSIFGLSAFVAQDDDPSSATLVEHLYASLWDPGLGLFRDGVLRVPGRTRLERPDLAGAFDMIGFSYYSTTGAKLGAPAIHPPGAVESALGDLDR